MIRMRAAMERLRPGVLPLILFGARTSAPYTIPKEIRPMLELFGSSSLDALEEEIQALAVDDDGDPEDENLDDDLDDDDDVDFDDDDDLDDDDDEDDDDDDDLDDDDLDDDDLDDDLDEDDDLDDADGDEDLVDLGEESYDD